VLHLRRNPSGRHFGHPSQLKTVIIELGVLEKPIIDIKIMKLAHLGAEIQIVQAWGNPFPKNAKNTIFCIFREGKEGNLHNLYLGS